MLEGVKVERGSFAAAGLLTLPSRLKFLNFKPTVEPMEKVPKSEILGEGSYGCAFKGGVPCRSERRSGSHVVGKILREKDAAIELNISAVLESVPDWKDYFVLQKEADCDAANFSKARHDLAAECTLLMRTKDDDLVQLLSSYGGKTLFDIPITQDLDFEAGLRHMLEGCVRLAGQGVCHFDLHEGNVVSGVAGVLRLIDFGSAIQGDLTTDKVVKDHTYSFSPEYPPQPPELAVQNGVAGGLDAFECVHKTIEAKRVFQLAESYLGTPRSEYLKALREFYSTDQAALEGINKKRWVDLYKKYWRKWDSWAVGVMFLGLARKRHLRLSATVKPVLRGLLMASPVNRLTAAEALALLLAGGH